MSTLSPREVTFTLIDSGIVKWQTRLDKTFFKAVMAGVYLSMGGLLATIVSAGDAGLTSSNPGVSKILTGLVFPGGLVMLVLTGQELLTNNMMALPMAIVTRQIPVWSILVNWPVVFFGNLAGSLLFAAVMVHYTDILSASPFPAKIAAAAVAKVEPSWWRIFLKGIACNWLVCTAIWLAAGARETVSKVIVLWFPIWIFVAAGFDHVVANMFSIPLGMLMGADVSVGRYVGTSITASLIGNIIGGIIVGLSGVYFHLRDYKELKAVSRMERGEPGEPHVGRNASSDEGSLVQNAVTRTEKVAASEV